MNQMSSVRPSHWAVVICGPRIASVLPVRPALLFEDDEDCVSVHRWPGATSLTDLITPGRMERTYSLHIFMVSRMTSGWPSMARRRSGEHLDDEP